ncbi:imm11 family protein [Roseovarius sp.]|uniref:imm11 family protein n=1 Tax=Roseovarius sp. TaxID=1486281 RepID=UPI003B5CD140
MFSERLKDALEAVDPALSEFVRTERTWDDVHKTPISGGPFYLANLLARRDCWDQDRTRIVPRKRGDGSCFNTISGSGRAVLRSRVADASIWREVLTQTVVC